MQIKDIAPSYGIAILMAASVFFLKYLSFSYWVVLPIQIVIGTIIFFGICHVTKREEYLEIKRMVEPYYKKKK